MFLLGAVSTFLSGKFTKGMMKAGAALVIALGISMLGRGFSLSGLQLGVASAASAGDAAVVQNGVQEITTSLESGRYVPITVQKGVPVRWTIRVESGDLNGCNNPMVIPAFGIEKELVPGDNVIEFTPQETGTIPYSCWMGMIRSSITVVDDLDDLSGAALDPAFQAQEDAAGSLPSCCLPFSN